MKKGQNNTHEKPYFNDGMTPASKQGFTHKENIDAILLSFNNNKHQKAKNVARASKKKKR